MTKEIAKRPYRLKLQLQLVCHWLILIAPLISLMLLYTNRPHFWLSTRLACAVSGMLALCTTRRIAHWRHALCWLGFFSVIYLDALTVEYGLTSTMEAGIFALILLAVTLFCIGIMDHLALTLCGITVAIMVSGTIMLRNYVPYVTIGPTLVIGYLMTLLLKYNIRTLHAIRHTRTPE